MMRSQFNNGLVTRDVASGASVRKDVEVQLLSAAPATRPLISSRDRRHGVGIAAGQRWNGARKWWETTELIGFSPPLQATSLEACVHASHR